MVSGCVLDIRPPRIPGPTFRSFHGKLKRVSQVESGFAPTPKHSV